MKALAARTPSERLAGGYYRGETMPQCTFKLNSPTLAIRLENDHRTIVTLPRDALVTLVDAGDIDVNGFVHVRFDNESLIMFAEDLRFRGERMLQQSA